METLAFILSTMGTVCICVPPLLKGKNMKLILLLVFSANMLVATSYLLTGAYNGAASCFVGGAQAITGAMDAGLRGEHTSFYAKAVVDGVACCIMATTLGIGVALSGVMLFIYQGGLSLASTQVAPYLTTAVVNELTAVGSLLIIAIGLNMLGLTKIKVVNLLPAVFIPVILCQFM